MQAEEPVGSEVSIYLDVQEATRRPVCLAHGRQVRGRVVGNEVVARECGEDTVGPWKPQSGFGGVTENHCSA